MKNLPKELESISKEIEHSKYILNLEEGWDDEDAKKIEPKIWNASINFLSNYAIFIYKNYKKIIEAPEINPCHDNTIDLSWRTKKAGMLINIKKKENKIIAGYYGEFHNKTNEIKNEIPIRPINKSLADWMKNLANE